ncbi:MAG: hypothetical protein WA964_19405 [Ilumatobacter sp.]|uniref:hypothetical protein n=1 Tax=Ilumatobacter sp. TaxID=1967498 RepID=UPI003C768B00
MNTHRFDPVSAVLAFAAMAGGLAVAFGATDPFGDADAGIWLAGLALAVGFVLIPWGRSLGGNGADDDDDAVVSDERRDGSDLVDLDA